MSHRGAATHRGRVNAGCNVQFEFQICNLHFSVCILQFALVSVFAHFAPWREILVLLNAVPHGGRAAYPALRDSLHSHGRAPGHSPGLQRKAGALRYGGRRLENGPAGTAHQSIWCTPKGRVLHRVSCIRHLASCILHLAFSGQWPRERSCAACRAREPSAAHHRGW
jgi:hypothetical protein